MQFQEGGSYTGKFTLNYTYIYYYKKLQSGDLEFFQIRSTLRWGKGCGKEKIRTTL